MPNRTDTQRFDELATEIDELLKPGNDGVSIDPQLLAISLAKLRTLLHMRILPMDGTSLRKEIDTAVRNLASERWSEHAREKIFLQHITTLEALQGSLVGGLRPKKAILQDAADFLRMIVVGFQQYIAKVHHHYKR